MDTAYKTTLELDKIIARAVQLCACQETKEQMQALAPYTTPEEERYALSQTNAVNALLIQNGSPRFGSVSQVRRITAHAQKGGILSMGELLEIAATLRNFAGLSQWYGASEHEMQSATNHYRVIIQDLTNKNNGLQQVLSDTRRQLAKYSEDTVPQLKDALLKLTRQRSELSAKVGSLIQLSQFAEKSTKFTPEAIQFISALHQLQDTLKPFLN